MAGKPLVQDSFGRELVRTGVLALTIMLSSFESVVTGSMSFLIATREVP